MGSCVNYVLVRDGEHTVYSQGGGAGHGIDYIFAAGPEVILRFLDNLGDSAGREWFDDIYCEGGVLVDVDRRVLLLFNTVYNQVVYRAAMLEAYAATWPGWEIRWAYDGIADLMVYVGVDPAGAHRDREPKRTERNEFGPDDRVAAVVTVRGADGRVRLYGLNPDMAWRRWFMGPDLVEWVCAGPELPESAEDMPTAGLDLDPAARRAGLWTVQPLRGLRQRWAELWPGWTLEFWGDDMARQAVHDPDRLYDSIRPSSIARDREELAKRLRTCWSVRSTILARGTSAEELQSWYDMNFGLIRNYLDADVSAQELERLAGLLRGA
ncbi:hypothetical protein GCM10009827_113650 [Dactylosporangium maewongense]|uniref:Uncharacterized protein n=1 Tax=Dactylosporangium maewongense TaxID=634393 RepID=A0ABN2D935_9ACTN